MSTPNPAWLAFARTLLGVAEIPGPRHNPVILSWWRILGAKVLGIAAKDDETAWCATFVAWCLNHCGIVLPPIACRASAYLAWGKGCMPVVGALAIFKRPGGYHIGIVTGERSDALLVLAGNQGNRVSEAWMPKANLVGCRWPEHLEVTTKRLMLTNDGRPIERAMA